MPVTYDLLTVRSDLIQLRKPLVLDSVGGLGAPPMRHLVQANAQQDGVTYLETWLDPRVVTFGLTAFCGCEGELWDVREQLVVLQAELALGYRLRVATPNGHRYMCDLRYAGGLDLPHDLHTPGNVLKAGWQGITHDQPTLYDPDLVTIDYDLGALLAQGFPISFPITFGLGLGPQPVGITYPGTWRTYPIIRITGPATNIIIYNLTNTPDEHGVMQGTTQMLSMSGYTLNAGYELIIDCTPGVKTVNHSNLGYVPYWLSSDSDLGTFCILPHPQAYLGFNRVQIACSGTGPTTTFHIEYYTRYLGI